MFSVCKFSHQYAGLNRSGTFRKPSRYTGNDRRGEGENGRRGDFSNEKWRRITGIYPHVEVSLKERRAGIARLVGWIEGKIQNAKRKIGAFADSSKSANHSHEPLSHEDSKTPSFLQSENSSCFRDFVVEVGAQSEGSATPHPAFAALTRGEGTGGTPAPHKLNTGGQATNGTRELSLVNEWEFSAESWARTRHRGVCVEEICVELGISTARLSALMKEYCGLSASEFVDGLMIRKLKPMLFEKIRAAAFELWGAPGSYVWEKLDVGRFAKSPGGIDSRFGKSRYFRARPKDLFEESRAEERARRLGELCEMLRVVGGPAALSRPEFRAQFGRARAPAPPNDAEVFALHAGFHSAARLKRACLNVFGKTLNRLEEILAEEVLQFYLCAEDRDLREIASRDTEIAIVFRARELYCKSEGPPREPFLDEWSKFEELRPHWLSRMKEMIRDA